MNYYNIKRWRKPLKAIRTIKNAFAPVISAMKWAAKYLGWMKYLNPKRYLKILDWYIIKKFIGTYFYAIALIISISIVFDVNENLAKFTQYHAPLKAVVFDYYMNFVPYFANLFSPLFVFIAVIFFTSKLAGNSEIISMLAAGVSKRRLMRPYMISAALISALTFYLGSYVIPKGTVVRQNFETLYKNKKKNTAAENVQLQVGKGVIAYIQFYDNNRKRGYGFCLDKFENKKVVSHMTATEIQYDTISESKYHWKATNWRIACDDGAHRPCVLERTAGDVHKPAVARLHKQADRQRIGQCGAIRGGVSQANSIIIRLVHTNNHRSFALLAKTKGRNGNVSRHRTCPEFRIYNASDGIGNIRHTGKHAGDACRMDSEHHLLCCCVVLLSQCS